jgi:hypothetical protein
MSDKRSSKNRRTCVAIVGSGRSGTSLVSRLVKSLGVSANFTLDDAGESNPDGFGEDGFVVEAHKEINRHLGTTPARPNFKDVESVPELRGVVQRLENYLDENTRLGMPWSFKDPRTADFLPMWRRIFNRTRVVPKYVLCVRNPNAVVKSFTNNYSDPADAAMLIWIMRNLAALRETGLNCFVLHYEKLLTDPVGVARQLNRFIHDEDKEIDEAAIKALVKKKLNRSSSRSDAKIENELASMLYDALLKAEGDQFDRDGLAEEIERVNSIVETFMPWAKAASAGARSRQEKKAGDGEQEDVVAKEREKLRERRQTLDAELQKVRELESSTKTLCKDLVEANSKLHADLARMTELVNQQKVMRAAQPAVPHVAVSASTSEKLQSLEKLVSQREAEIANVKRVKYREVQAVTADKNLEIKTLKESKRYRAGMMLLEIKQRPLVGLLSLPRKLWSLR